MFLPPTQRESGAVSASTMLIISHSGGKSKRKGEKMRIWFHDTEERTSAGYENDRPMSDKHFYALVDLAHTITITIGELVALHIVGAVALLALIPVFIFVAMRSL